MAIVLVLQGKGDAPADFVYVKEFETNSEAIEYIKTVKKSGKHWTDARLTYNGWRNETYFED